MNRMFSPAGALLQTHFVLPKWRGVDFECRDVFEK